MVKIRTLGLICFAIIMVSISYAQQKEVQMSLAECIASAVQNNLNIKVEIFNPQLAETVATTAKERFMPMLSFGYNLRNTESASYSFLEGTETVKTAYNDFGVQLYQELPIGGNISATLSSYVNDTNQLYQTINPRYGTTLSFNYTQPLLKNFGLQAGRREIIIAHNNQDISESQFKDTLMTTVYNVEQAYWTLVLRKQNLEVRKQSLALAQDLLRKNQKEVEVGTLAPIEIYTAEAEVATREADILEAEVQMANTEDTLKTYINRFSESEAGLVEIIPKDKPQYYYKELSLDEALKTALLNRPDLQSSYYDLKNKEFDVGYARNQLLPELNLTANYWSPGISGTLLNYENNDPSTGNIIDTVPGSPSDSLQDALNFKYPNWSIGLTFTIPTSSVFSRAQYTQATLSLDQALASIKSQEQRIFLEVRTAVRLVQTNYKRVEAYKAARELAEKKLEVEEKKLRVGMTTNYIVLQHQRDLATAQINELQAIIDYNLSLAALDRAMGITLDQQNIKLEY